MSSVPIPESATGRRPTVFRPARVARELVRAFVELFFERRTPIDAHVPELRGFSLTREEVADPVLRKEGIESRVTVSEAFVGTAEPDGTGPKRPRFPLVLITYPDFNEIETGIGSLVNKQDDYFESGPGMGTFLWEDIVRRRRWEIGWSTDSPRFWQVLRHHARFSVNIDVITSTLESRQDLADLVRVLWDHHVASLAPSPDLSSELVLDSYQFETDGEKPSSVILGETRTYPPFFPYGVLRVSFDVPYLTGSGDYDNIEIWGADNLYMTSFSIEDVRVESFQLVERPGGTGFYTNRLDPQPTTDLSSLEPSEPMNARDRARARSC